jgi:hypothetical protein
MFGSGSFSAWTINLAGLPGTYSGGPLGNMSSQNANAVAITGGTITGMPSPTNPTDVATKQYVDLPIVAVADGIVTFPKMAASALATAAQFINNTSSKILTADQIWAAANPVALTDAATITPDFSAGIDFIVTLAGTRTLANGSNLKNGQKGVIYFIQDATGNRGISVWGSYWKFPGGVKPTFSTAPNTIDAISYVILNGSSICCNFSAGFA